MLCKAPILFCSARHGRKTACMLQCYERNRGENHSSKLGHLQNQIRTHALELGQYPALPSNLPRGTRYTS
jgi:hypothetical protein